MLYYQELRSIVPIENKEELHVSPEASVTIPRPKLSSQQTYLPSVSEPSFFNGDWKVAHASHLTTETQQRYAQRVKEAFALVWACRRFRDYLYGLPIFHAHTDLPLCRICVIACNLGSNIYNSLSFSGWEISFGNLTASHDRFMLFHN